GCLFPEARLVDDWAELSSGGEPSQLLIADPLPLVEAAERTEGQSAGLPHCWDATTDSVAAWIAARLDAEELVLLKSRLPQRARDVQQAAAEGYVDAQFPRIAESVRRVRCVDLRNSALAETVLLP